MRVAAYVHISRTRDPTTGVGKHMINMVRGLAETPGFEVEALASRQELNADGSIPVKSRLHGMPVRSLPFSRTVMERLWAITRMPKVDRAAGNPDWVYCAAEVYLPVRRARLAVTIHCVNWFEPTLPWYDSPNARRVRLRMGIRWRQILKRSDVVLTVSHFLKDRITALFGTDPRKIVVVGNGVEEQYFQAGQRPMTMPRNSEPYLLVVGGLTVRKGGEHILAIGAALAARNSPIKIKVVGLTEPAFRAALAASPNMIDGGFLGLDVLPDLMRNSIALLFLSRYETFGIPAVEAMAAGTPAIVANFAALPEVVGDAGVVVNSEHTEAIVDLCQHFHEDAAFRDEYVRRGQQHAEQYHWNACVERLATTLREH